MAATDLDRIRGLTLSPFPLTFFLTHSPFPISPLTFSRVEPDFFRTDFLDERNVRWPSESIEDYAAEGRALKMWSVYNGTQQGDPEKLGEAQVTIADMANPPKQFHAGSDAVTVIRPALEARLQEIQAYDELFQVHGREFPACTVRRR